MMKGWRVLFLLISFSCGAVAVAFSAQEDESSISVFDTVSEIVNKIGAARDWDLNQVRILNIDSENVKFTKATIYELNVQIGDEILPAKFIDDVTNWRSLKLLYKEENKISSPDSDTHVEKGSLWPYPILNMSDPRFSILEEMLKVYIRYSRQKKSFAIVNAKVAACTFVRFEFEIERDLNTTEEYKSELWPEWKTRPNVKRYSFQVLAEVQENTLIPISVQPLKRYKAVETYAWRDVTSNISYTSFSTYLGPFSPMTLDIY